MRKETGLVVTGTMTRAWPNQSWSQEERQTFLDQTKDLDDEVSMEVVNYCVQHEEFRPSIAKFRDHHMRIARGHMSGFEREEPTLNARDRAAAEFFGPRLTDITGSPVWGKVPRLGEKVKGRSGGMFAGDPDEGKLIKLACDNLIGEWIEECERRGWDYVDPRSPSER